MRGPIISIIFRGCKIAESLTEIGLKFYPDGCQFLATPSPHEQIDNIMQTYTLAQRAKGALSQRLDFTSTRIQPAKYRHSYLTDGLGYV